MNRSDATGMLNGIGGLLLICGVMAGAVIVCAKVPMLLWAVVPVVVGVVLVAGAEWISMTGKRKNGGTA